MRPRKMQLIKGYGALLYLFDILSVSILFLFLIYFISLPYLFDQKLTLEVSVGTRAALGDGAQVHDHLV